MEIDCIEQHAASPQKQRQRQRLPDRGGGPANVIAFPRRQREPRTARSASPLRKQLFASVRETLDGEDAALWDEMVRVLRACGVDPETCGRKTRAAVLGALRVNSHDSAATIAGWGNLMVNRWREYGAAGDVLFAPVGFTRFVSEGLWLNPKLWRYNHERVREIRRGGW